VVAADRHGAAPDRSRAQRQLVGVLFAFLATAVISVLAYEAFSSFTHAECAAAEQERTRRARSSRFEEVRSRAWLARRFGNEYLESCYAEQLLLSPRSPEF
jgi:hypothetical protein